MEAAGQDGSGTARDGTRGVVRKRRETKYERLQYKPLSRESPPTASPELSVTDCGVDKGSNSLS